MEDREETKNNQDILKQAPPVIPPLTGIDLVTGNQNGTPGDQCSPNEAKNNKVKTINAIVNHLRHEQCKIDVTTHEALRDAKKGENSPLTLQPEREEDDDIGQTSVGCNNDVSIERTIGQTSLGFNNDLSIERKASVCEHCFHEFPSDTLLNKHFRTGCRALDQRQDLPFQCLKCDQYFREKEHFAEHETACSKGWKRICQYCCKVFHNNSSLNRHQKVRCPVKLAEAESTHKKGLLNTSEEKPYSCSYCKGRFKQRDTVMRHQRNSCPVFLKMCKVEFKCEKCDRKFKGRRGLQEHKKWCKQSYQGNCHDCGKTFLHKSSLQRHQRHECPTAVDNEKIQECKSCMLLFTSKEELDTHKCMSLRNAPIGAAALEECDEAGQTNMAWKLCNAQFATKEEYFRHIGQFATSYTESMTVDEVIDMLGMSKQLASPEEEVVEKKEDASTSS